jgi:hypothetical protein
MRPYLLHRHASANCGAVRDASALHTASYIGASSVREALLVAKEAFAHFRAEE